MQTITIPYKAREWAKSLHEAKKRWSVVILHRRAGKTVACVNHLIRDCLRTEKANFAYISPSYVMSKRIAWDYVKQYTLPIPGMSYNESELRADFPNGSKLYLLGAERPDSLRGLSLWGVIFDEYSQQPASIFTEVVRPALADHEGYAIWAGTPKGFNDLVRLYRDNQGKDDWYTLLLKASESGVLPQKELDSLKETMSPEEYAQELEVSFEAFIKGAYYQVQLDAMRREKRITSVPIDPTVPVDCVWDLGWGDSTAILFAQRVGQQVRIVDAIENNGKALPWYAQEIKNKNYLMGKHYLPHDAEHHELGTGLSRKETLEGIFGKGSCEIVESLSIEEGIEAARRIFPACWIEERLTGLIDALSQYQKEFDDKRGVFKNNPLHDWTSHYADSWRYMAITYMKKKRSAQISQFIPKY